MEVVLNKLSKRYIHEWIFRDLSTTLPSGSRTAIVGPNGSGKSTLLQIISGYRLPSSGKIQFIDKGKEVPNEDVFKWISFASPYLDLVEEFTLAEQLDFHFKYRKTKLSYTEVAEIFELDKALNKLIKYFSSGMKQRLKLALAFASESDMLLLDEPTSNLDQQGILIYNDCLESMLYHRTLVIASNDPKEYKICNSQILIENFKV